MATIKKITKAYIRTYSDSGQHKSYVEWIDTDGTPGRTEGDAMRLAMGRTWYVGGHMKELFARAEREGITLEQQTW